MWITDYNNFFSKNAFKNINPFILRFQIRKKFQDLKKLHLVYMF